MQAILQQYKLNYFNKLIKSIIMKGRVELYQNDKCIASKSYNTKKRRTDIISEWYTNYRLHSKKNVYIQISHLTTEIRTNYAR